GVLVVLIADGGHRRAVEVGGAARVRRQALDIHIVEGGQASRVDRHIGGRAAERAAEGDVLVVGGGEGRGGSGDCHVVVVTLGVGGSHGADQGAEGGGAGRVGGQALDVDVAVEARRPARVDRQVIGRASDRPPEGDVAAGTGRE